MQLARHVLDLQRAMKYEDLQEYIQMQVQLENNESYGAAILKYNESINLLKE